MAKNGHGPAINRRDLGGACGTNGARQAPSMMQRSRRPSGRVLPPIVGSRWAPPFMKPSSMAMLRRRAPRSALRGVTALPYRQRLAHRPRARQLVPLPQRIVLPGAVRQANRVIRRPTSSSAQILHASWMKPKPHC